MSIRHALLLGVVLEAICEHFVNVPAFVQVISLYVTIGLIGELMGRWAVDARAKRKGGAA